MLKRLSLFFILFSISCVSVESSRNYAGPIRTIRQQPSTKGFFWPAEGKAVSADNGLDIRVDSSKKNVRASASGQVVYCNELKGWGKTVILKHNSNTYTVYANLDNSFLTKGRRLNEKEQIGQVASGADGNHVLHFEIRKHSLPQDPLIYLN